MEKQFESPIRHHESYESQMSAPQEISSASHDSETRKTETRGVVLPQSVAKASKAKLANIQLSM